MRSERAKRNNLDADAYGSKKVKLWYVKKGAFSAEMVARRKERKKEEVELVGNT